MGRLINKIWCLSVSLCLAITVGYFCCSIITTQSSAEEISLQAEKVEASEILVRGQERQLRRTANGNSHIHQLAIASHSALQNASSDFARRCLQSERHQMNGFGGYLRT